MIKDAAYSSGKYTHYLKPGASGSEIVERKEKSSSNRTPIVLAVERREMIGAVSHRVRSDSLLIETVDLLSMVYSAMIVGDISGFRIVRISVLASSWVFLNVFQGIFFLHSSHLWLGGRQIHLPIGFVGSV